MEIAKLTDAAVERTDGELLAAVDAAAAKYRADNGNPNTARAHASDWKAWADFCDIARLPHSPATSGSLSAYVLYLFQDGQAPATIDRRLSGVVVGQRERGHPVADQAKVDARRTLDIGRRKLAEAGVQRGRGKATAVTVRDLRVMVEACPDGLAGVRDRAVLLIGFSIAARRSELANLRVEDVAADANGLLVSVRFGKTGARVVAVKHGQNPATCPVLAWKAWLTESGVTTGPAFRWIDRHGNMRGQRGLSGAAIGEVVSRAVVRAGIKRTTAHGLRAGLATEARRAGHDAKTIGAQGGWVDGSAAVHGYMRIVDQWSDNALTGIGL